MMFTFVEVLLWICFCGISFMELSLRTYFYSFFCLPLLGSFTRTTNSICRFFHTHLWAFTPICVSSFFPFHGFASFFAGVFGIPFEDNFICTIFLGLAHLIHGFFFSSFTVGLLPTLCDPLNSFVLGSKTLGTKCIRTLIFIMLANHDQNI